MKKLRGLANAALDTHASGTDYEENGRGERI
jgi:hypothetical protein